MKRQKVLFLRENYVLKILKNFMVAGLFAIALLLILVHKIDLGLISGVSKGIFFITAPLIRIAALPADIASFSYKKAAEIVYIYQENEKLRKENQELFLLKEKIRAVRTENKILKKLLNHINLPSVKSYTAHVIAENGNAFTNSLIIYLGNAAPEIKKGYAVINDKGLVGRIDMVSGAYARVMLITDINSKIPVISQKSRDRGILTGNNTRKLSLIFTPLMAELNKDDLLVTSGIGGGLPADIPVARITSTEVENITATPLFSTSSLEIIKIIAYDILPDNTTTGELD